MNQMALNRVKTILYTVVAKNSPHKGRNIIYNTSLARRTYTERG
jgi:hypothetical protein